MSCSTLLGLPLCLAFAAVPAISQEVAVGNVHTHIEGIEIPPIPDAPFSAREVVTWNEPLVGGGTVSRTYYTLVARDSQGRVHREMREFVPANSASEPPLRSITILDPVAGTRTTCTKAWKTCAVSAFDPNQILAENAADQGNANRENLGQQTIQGLPTTGTRETVSNAVGPRGSSRVALSRTDAWYSADLQIDLSVTRTDPQSGVVTLDVTELVQGEPASSWFAIPPGYTVKGGKTP
jgi:hypothetical protein